MKNALMEIWLKNRFRLCTRLWWRQKKKTSEELIIENIAEPQNLQIKYTF